MRLGFSYPSVRLILPLLMVASQASRVAHAYQVCEVEGPKPQNDSCFVHFGEGRVDLDAAAKRELIQCLEKFNWPREVELIGHADACTQDLAGALALSDRKYWTSQDTGNSVLGETRASRVASAMASARAERGYNQSMTLQISNEADSGSGGHDADDRTVEIRMEDSAQCEWNYVFDGSGSMDSVWPSLAATTYPKGSCFFIVVGDGMHCPATLKGYHPYGSTYIYTAVAERFTNKKGVVVLSDFKQPDARQSDREKVNAAIKAGKIKYWTP